MSNIAIINDNNNFAPSIFQSLCEFVGGCFGPRYFSLGATLPQKNTSVQNNHLRFHTMTSKKMVRSYYCLNRWINQSYYSLFILALHCVPVRISRLLFAATQRNLPHFKLKWIQLYCDTAMQWHHNHCAQWVRCHYTMQRRTSMIGPLKSRGCTDLWWVQRSG